MRRRRGNYVNGKAAINIATALQKKKTISSSTFRAHPRPNLFYI